MTPPIRHSPGGRVWYSPVTGEWRHESQPERDHFRVYVVERLAWGWLLTCSAVELCETFRTLREAMVAVDAVESRLIRVPTNGEEP
jgi:hypothetical protein